MAEGSFTGFARPAVPTPQEIRDWALDAYSTAPEGRQWDLTLATDELVDTWLDLAADATCPKRSFALHVLYIYAGDAVRTKFRVHSRKRVDKLLEKAVRIPGPVCWTVGRQHQSAHPPAGPVRLSRMVQRRAGAQAAAAQSRSDEKVNTDDAHDAAREPPMTQQPDPNMRVSNAEREAIIAKLHLATEEGRLDLDEFADRSRQAYEARTYAEVEGLLADLPETTGTLAVPVGAGLGTANGPLRNAPQPEGSSVERKGDWAVPPKIIVKALGSSVKLDCRHARIHSSTVDLDVNLIAASLRSSSPKGPTRSTTTPKFRQFVNNTASYKGGTGIRFALAGKAKGSSVTFPLRAPIPLVAMVIDASSQTGKFTEYPSTGTSFVTAA